MKTFADRLKALLNERGTTGVDMAGAMGVKVRTFRSWTTGDRTPEKKHLITMADIFGVTTDYLLTGNSAPDVPMIDETGDVSAQVKGHLGPDLSDDDFAMIRLNKAHLSAGPGFIPAEEHFYGALAFNRSWLKREGVNPKAASLIRVKGDSMEPTLLDGATVLVDHQRRDPAVRKGIYALRIGDELFVKRLEAVDGLLVITSDNTTYSSRALGGAQLVDVDVIGRVVWQGYTFRDLN